jgi:hypothetical protein
MAAPEKSRKQKASAPPLKKRFRRKKKRFAMGEALRASGVDERAVASAYARAIEQEGDVEKLLVEILKECARHLEPPGSLGQVSADDGPAVVQLVHNVPRPARTAADGEQPSE